MKLTRFALAFGLVVGLCSTGYGQSSKPALQSQISSSLPDNTVGAITPAIVRNVLNSMVNSWQQFASVNAQVGISYTIQTSDYGQLITFNNALPVAVTVPQATGSFQTFNFFAANLGAGTVTLTPAVGSINGAASYQLLTGQSVWIVGDGANWQVSTGKIPSVAAVTNNWIDSISTLGVPHLSQPAFSNLSGQATLGQLPNLNADSIIGNFTGGVLAPGQQVLPSCSTITSALIYNTSTHTLGCNSLAASGGQCYIYTAVGGDNTAALNTAITAALAANLTLCLPGGTIQISSTVNFASNLRVRGAGRDVTVIQKTPSSGAATMLALCPAATSNIILSDLTVDMNASTIASIFYGIGCSQGISNVLIERIRVKNPYNGGLLEITGDGTTPTVPNGKQINTNVIIRDNIFDCSTNTVSNNGDCVNPLWIDGLYFVNNELIGGQANLFSGEFNRHFLIQGNKIHGGWRNLYMETSQDGNVRDNEIYTLNATSANGNVTAYGIWMPDANQTYSNGGYAGSSRVTVSGNKIHDLTRSTGNTGINCIAVSAPGTTLTAKDIVIRDNTCFNSGVTDNSGTTTLVRLEGGSDTITVVNNYSRTITTPAVGITTTASYTPPGMAAAQATTNLSIKDNTGPQNPLPTVTGCTGIGSTGTCAVTSTSTDQAGNILITAGGSGLAASGIMQLNLSVNIGPNASNCVWQGVNGGNGWTAPVTFYNSGNAPNTNTVAWNNGAALTAGTYDVGWVCQGR